MGALELRHKENILYREDEMDKRVELLHRWTASGEVDLKDFNRLIKSCDKDQLEKDTERRYGARIG